MKKGGRKPPDETGDLKDVNMSGERERECTALRLVLVSSQLAPVGGCGVSTSPGCLLSTLRPASAAECRRLEWWCRQPPLATRLSCPLRCASLASHKAWVSLPNLGIPVYHRMAMVTTKHRSHERNWGYGLWLPLGWASQITLELYQPRPWLYSELDLEVSSLQDFGAGDLGWCWKRCWVLR